MRLRTVLFDLDGTLIDSGAIILASMRHAAETVLERSIPDEDLMAAVGGPGLVAQMRALDPERVDELVRVYREHNEPLHAELQACDGILDVLPELRRLGATLGIVTAKRLATVRLAFEVIAGLEEFFDTVVGSDETERHKPQPDPILLALDRLGADPATAAYVGDSPFDVQAAKAAGVHAVAVTWGRIHDEERLAQEEPDALVHTAEELLAAL
ncbi:MAG: HAD-IA family hydrolase [Thermoleophilia bacterium]|nr:HAD-IA family hydrolase [Thermoleophilia bacterium]